MKPSRIIFFGLTAVVLGGGVVNAEQQTGFPERGSRIGYEGAYAAVDKSGGPVTPLILSTQDIAWNGSGPVNFTFRSNQRARVWLAVYRKGSNETGPRGPFGAWQRLQPQDLYVWSSPGADLESGNNTITWDGRDFEGNAAGPGNYEFDLIAFNVLDTPTLVGPSLRTGFADNVIDLRTNEIWVGEYDRDAPSYGGHKMGDVIRGTLGTNYLANPNAWERWDYSNVVDFEGAQTLGGMKVDPDDPQVFFTSNRQGEKAGIFKMTINRAGRSWDAATEWAENGFAAVATEGIRMFQMEPWKEFLVNPNWSSADVPASSIEYFDKASGEVVKQLDVAEWFTSTSVDGDGNEILRAGGPASLSIDDSGVWVTGYGTHMIAKVDHDGSTLWVNENGDGFGDRVTYEIARETGLTPAVDSKIRINADYSGHVAYYSPRNSEGFINYAALGRDGTGILKITVNPATFGPFRPWSSGFMVLIDRNRSKTGGSPLNGPNAGQRGPWDGMYWDSAFGLVTHEFDCCPEGAKFGAGMLFHVPYDLVSGRLGAGVTAVESVENAATPISYTLGEAYPNPFNPETTIEFSVPTDGFVKVDVYNTAGQLVSSLVDKDLSAGAYKTTWDAMTQDGQQASSGVYFYRMEAGDFTDTRSMTLLK